MNQWKASMRLLRLDKPVGIWLLWFPTAWALWLANLGMPPLNIILLFFLGTVLMRSAGCAVNDMADRHIDGFVQRTCTRPLASGELSLFHASIMVIALLIAAACVLIKLPKVCFPWAIAALALTSFYPFCKRFFQTPQVILGLAFSMGIPMAFVATGTSFDSIIFLLFAINFLWIVAYDTMYAMTDREDDVKIGVKSTAVYLATYDCIFIGSVQTMMHLGWLFIGYIIQASWAYYFCWLLALGVLLVQQRLIINRQPTECFQAFKISVYYGVLMWCALIVGL